MAITWKNSRLDNLVSVDQQRLTFINSTRTLDAILRTCQERWTIEMHNERKSQRNPFCLARLNDDEYIRERERGGGGKCLGGFHGISAIVG